MGDPMNKPERQTLNGGESNLFTLDMRLCDCGWRTRADRGRTLHATDCAFMNALDPDATLPAFRSLSSEEINAALEVLK